jgi:thioredoxin 1
MSEEKGNVEPRVLSQENFEQTISGAKPVLVDFFATWCGPCQMMLPVLHDIAKEEAEQSFIVGALNIDDAPEIAAKYGVMSVPSFVVFKDGKEVARMMGAMPKEMLVVKVKSAIK